MKKLFRSFLILLLSFLMISCTESNTITLKYDEFFSKQILLDSGLSLMPKAKIENSATYENSFYGNLTDEEFETYVQDVIDYLNKQGYVYLGVNNDKSEIYTPLTESYKIQDINYFVFSKKRDLQAENKLISPVMINIIRKNNSKILEFSYNTLIEIITDKDAYFNLCSNGHYYYHEVDAPVLGTDKKVNVKCCYYCYEFLPDETIGSGKEYKVNLGAYGELADYEIAPKTCKAGDVCYIMNGPVTDGGSFLVTANGEVLEVVTFIHENPVYVFIMPECDVTISPLE